MPQKRDPIHGQISVSCVSAFESALREGLAEDGWEWDWTTLGAARGGSGALGAKIIAKSSGVWAGEALIAALARIEPRLRVTTEVGNGERLKPGRVVAEWKGPARELLALERPFVNLAAYVGGIATQTRELKERIREACPVRTPRLTATRKTLPRYRDIAIYGVIAGGGHSHRVSLSGGVLIKENHIAAAGGIERAIEGVRSVAPHGLLIEIEVRNEKELARALGARAGGVLLDNFSPVEIRSALRLIEAAPLRPVVEVSGGLNAENIGEYAIEGVDVLSSGSLTHSVRALDLSLLVGEGNRGGRRS